ENPPRHLAALRRSRLHPNGVHRKDPPDDRKRSHHRHRLKHRLPIVTTMPDARLMAAREYAAQREPTPVVSEAQQYNPRPMDLIVIRHGRAGSPAEFASSGMGDDLRPLTVEGRKRMRRNAEGLRSI